MRTANWVLGAVGLVGMVAASLTGVLFAVEGDFFGWCLMTGLAFANGGFAGDQIARALR
jgi:hypothetical protein